MKHLLLTFFTWWNSETWGTRFFTWKKGEFVGTDETGNKYYTERVGKRRWVIYKHMAEASQIPPGWHGWMHHRTDTPPTQSGYVAHEWEVPHSPNLTGTPNAYRPKGSILTPENRPEVTGDYHAWTPGE